jgi:hypothetical protein
MAAATTMQFARRFSLPRVTNKKKVMADADPIPAASAGNDASSPEKPLSQKDKAQIRRAQVRRAQIQHRQRKANYVKELELDVSRFRELVSQTEREVLILRRENEAIKVTLTGAGVDSTMWVKPALSPSRSHTQSLRSGASPRTDITPLLQQQENDLSDRMKAQHLYDLKTSPALLQAPDTDMFGNIDVDDLTVMLSMDPTMGTPAFSISSGASGIQSNPNPVWGNRGFQMSYEQEQLAINFVLGLEHVCWNHFSNGHFHTHSDQSDDEMGHALMASAYCMSTAPASVYTDRKMLTPQSRSLLGSKSPAPSGAAIRWQGPSMTLDSLYGLAGSLNAGDAEVAPVQAWFELASRYGAARMVDPQVLEALKREFRGVVRCVFFGAAMERGSFESVVGRVMGPTAQQALE